MPSAGTPYLVSKFLKYTAYCVFPFTRKRLPVMILQIGISSILLKLLIEEERVDAAIVTNGQNSRV
jgi:coenzyme F420-reducing hydrogenase beta subunit